MAMLKVFLKDSNNGVFALPDIYILDEAEATRLTNDWTNQPYTDGPAFGVYKCKVIHAANNITSRDNTDIMLMLRFKDVAAIG